MDVRLQKLAAAVPTLLVDIVDDMLMMLRGNARCACPTQTAALQHCNSATPSPLHKVPPPSHTCWS
jgi:hypothetical protein